MSRDKGLVESLGTGWAELSCIVVIESDRRVAGKANTSDRQYCVSSRAETADYFLLARRAHWQIENGLHRVVDVAFREDESRLRKGDGAENASVPRRMAVTPLRGETTEKGGVEAKRYRAGRDEKYVQAVLAGLRNEGR